MRAPVVYRLTGTARQLAEMGRVTSTRLGKLTRKGASRMRCGVVVERVGREWAETYMDADELAAVAVGSLGPLERARLRSAIKGALEVGRQ